ncbi:fatty acyl-AMP ligase [Streptomyces cinnamoneus]|uniref:fatty acyl-AMP ligase n=1 Tax=Streptomyces cinnamoneus TaxID=53446 RepID=UPI001E43B3B6|nr:fatty acyl-AMP ligase [Streptomyces cinnamoneus]
MDDMSPVPETSRSPVSLSALLARRSRETPDALAYVYLRNGEDPAERVTYRELHRQSLVRAAHLQERGTRGRSAVLLYPTGIEFVRTWLGCAAAGVMGAPVQVPRNSQGLRRLHSVAQDSGADLVLTTAEVRDRLIADFPSAPELRGLELLATDDLPDLPDLPNAGGQDLEPGLDDVALLQYTSGSTGTPKGVMVTHRNFWHNAAETDALWPCEGGTAVSWLPLFHDMGLLFGVVLPLWAGIPSYLMGPEAFIRRPARWLEAISRFHGTHAAAPNFAYDLCVREARPAAGTDLSSWRAAVNGAEPVRLHTVHTFTQEFAEYGLDPRAVSPGYGLAEHTLKICGSPPDREPSALMLSAQALGAGQVTVTTESGALPVVSCGRTVSDTRVRIVDPQTLQAVGPDRVGEIWASGPCVARGYIGREQESTETFRARIKGEEEAGEFLRTGDVGFERDGEVYITGRLKDLLVVKGRNHYPQDLEYSAERSHPALRPTSAAAFSVDTGDREALVVVIEADGRALRTAGSEALAAAVRRRIREDHRLDAEDVVVIRRGTLPRTTSGKVRRSTCRQQYAEGNLARVDGA